MLNGITLPKTECTKFLGTWLDDKLVWTEHVKRLKTKLANQIGPTQTGVKDSCHDTCNENAILCPNQ